jgi:hypothetical protein
LEHLNEGQSATLGAGAAMAVASAWLQVVATMIQTFGGFFVSLVQQQLSKELVMVINPKSMYLVLQEFNGRGNKSELQIFKLAQRKRVIFLEK